MYRIALIILAVFFLQAPSLAADAGLSQWLKRGGHVLLIAHGPVDTLTHSTHPQADFEGCVSQHNLSPEGQRLAKRIGRTLGKFPIGEVLAAPHCRTQDTARLAFGRETVWDALDLESSLPPEEAQRRAELVTARIGGYGGPANLVLVTHPGNIDSLTLELVEPGTILVLQPGGGASFKVVARLDPKDLAR